MICPELELIYQTGPLKKMMSLCQWVSIAISFLVKNGILCPLPLPVLGLHPAQTCIVWFGSASIGSVNSHACLSVMLCLEGSFLPAFWGHLLEILCLSFYPGVMSILNDKVCFLDTAQRWMLFSNLICCSCILL